MKKTLLTFVFFVICCSPFTIAQGRFDATVFAGLNMSQIDGDGAT